MKNCKDCGIEIHEMANHTGAEFWCEDCFDIGLKRDMNDHFAHTVKKELEEMTHEEEIQLLRANMVEKIAKQTPEQTADMVLTLMDEAISKGVDAGFELAKTKMKENIKAWEREQILKTFMR